MMDVVLVHPPRVFEKAKGAAKTFRPPLGLLYLGAALEKGGIEVKIIDALAQQLSLEEVLSIIERERPKVVGISATTLQTPAAVQLGKALAGKNIVVCLGGAHVSADLDFIKHFPYFDFAVVGEGEVTFPKLVKKILKKQKVSGIHFGEFVKDLDSLKPARHLVDYKDYMLEEYGHKFASMIANRGCPFNCLYCSKPVCGRKVRFRSVDSIVEEVEECMREREVDIVMFEDDTMTLDKKQVLKLCERMKELGVKWICETRIDLVDEELLRKMKEGGCVEISFGVESGNERIRNEIVRKNLSTEKIYETFALCKKLGIKTDAFFMLGFPTEGEEEVWDTIEMSLKIKADIVGIHLSVPMPGSDLYEIALKEKIIDKKDWDKYAEGKAEPPIFVPKNLTLDYLRKARLAAYKKFYFTPKFVLRRLVSDLRHPAMILKDFFLAVSIYRYGRPSTGRE